MVEFVKFLKIIVLSDIEFEVIRKIARGGMPDAWSRWTGFAILHLPLKNAPKIIWLTGPSKLAKVSNPILLLDLDTAKDVKRHGK
ncbi:hypothetical protein TIFTF001_016128 [Ficus carica]|uniref:Uncharacterized protein n=1 Tax=Ficus carica TaxID=3494 RepID=A0AA88A6Y7_FICCA|nr:hypothetical protein TIFTF001_016128 [Ficus carica]